MVLMREENQLPEETMALRTGHAPRPRGSIKVPLLWVPHTGDGLWLVGSWAQRQLLLKDEAQAEDRMGWHVWTARVVMQGVQGAQPGV